MHGAAMLTKLRSLVVGLIAATCLLGPLAHAQLDAGVPDLSEAETLRLREILNKPIDPGMLNLAKSQLHRQKDLAAFQLGDLQGQIANAREWMKVEPIDGKWTLVLTLAGTEQRAESYRLGQEIMAEMRWPPSAARMMAVLANLYVEDGNIKEAGRLIEAAEAKVRYEFRQMQPRGDIPFQIARAETEFYAAKARYLMRTGKWSEAIESAKLATEKARQLLRMANLASNPSAQTFARSWAFLSMGELAANQMAAGLYSDAEWTLREIHTTATGLGFTEKQFFGFFTRLSDLYNATGQYKDGLVFADRGEKILLSRGFNKGSPTWLNNRTRSVVALAGQGSWPQALATLDNMDAQREPAAQVLPESDLLTLARGYVYLKNKRAEPALAVLGERLRQHIDNYGPTHYHTATLRGLYAAALWQNNQAAQARTEFDKAMQNITAPESLSGDFVENAFQRKTKEFVLQSYMQLLAITAPTNRQDAEIIFQVADQLSASSVQQALSDAAVRAGVSIPGLSDIIRPEQDAKNEIATLTSYIAAQAGEDDKKRNPQVVEQMRLRMRELEAARKTYKAEINKRYPEYFQLIQPRSPTPADIAKELQADEMFVSVLPLEDKTFLWAIDAKGTVNFQISELGDKQTNALVDRLRKTLDVADLGANAPTFDYAGSHQLYQQLLGPFEAALADKKHLIVAGSGALAKLPLAVLTRTAFTGRDAAQAPWLVKDVAVSYVPTANGWLSLKRLGKASGATQPLMAWGDPSFDRRAATQVAANPAASVVRSAAALRSANVTARNVLDPDTYVTYSKLPPLPETRDEVLQLAKILAANPEQDVVLGANATRESVLKSSSSGQLARKQVVVFATHGLLAGDLPNLNQPALAMASTANPTDSPLLTLEDVLSLKLNADWVVLSACNTAGADGRAGEALTGLARGFFFAGSRSLLVTHWSVESESATLLTTSTFAAYKKDSGIRRADALRTAMLDTMKQPRFAHPAYWAPYALVGEGGR